MKKMKLIALTMVVALMMVGAGYAAWTDALTINQTVHTGNLDVEFVSLSGNEITTVKGLVNGSVAYPVDNDGEYDTANINIENAYPGAEYKVKLRMVNKGTMPVKLSGVPTGSWNDWDEIMQSQPTISIQFSDDTTQYDGYAFSSYQNKVIPVGGLITMEVGIVSADKAEESKDYSISLIPTFKLHTK